MALFHIQPSAVHSHVAEEAQFSLPTMRAERGCRLPMSQNSTLANNARETLPAAFSIAFRGQLSSACWRNVRESIGSHPERIARD